MANIRNNAIDNREWRWKLCRVLCAVPKFPMNQISKYMSKLGS